MRKKAILLAAAIGSFISIQATTVEETTATEEVFATCTGEFKIDGKSYEITLEGASVWTCVKFKVGSWFK